jgi:hypothetical protein
MPFTLLCLIPDSKSVFPVDIDENKTVGHLKKEIKKETEPEFNAFAAHALTMYKAHIDISVNRDQKIEEICSSDYIFELKEKLNPERKISKYFTVESDETISILIRPPEGNSIDSRACDVRRRDAALNSSAILVPRRH